MSRVAFLIAFLAVADALLFALVYLLDRRAH